MMSIDLTGIVIIVGNYGSGKTEVAINLAVSRKKEGIDVRLADLDLVNPYFRTREVREPLRALGIDVVLPAEPFLNADLPILSPEVAGMLRQPAELTLLDVGGDDVGATVLATLSDVLRGKRIQVLQVVNPFRPFTSNVSGCRKVLDEIEAASRLEVTGLVGNANLIDDTTAQDIYQGYDFLKELSARSGLPLVFITAAAGLLPHIDSTRFGCPVLAIKRQLVPPWRKAAPLAAPNRG